MIWQILLFSFIIWLVYFRWSRRKLFRMASQLKCDIKTLPLIGHAYLFIGDGIVRMDGLKLLSKQAIKYGLTNLWLAHRHFVLVADAQSLEFIMKYCLEKDDTMNLFKDFLGNGSLFAPVSIWRPRRKILAPLFSPKILKSFVDIFSQQSSTMVDQLLIDAPTENFSIWKYFTTYSMDSICVSAMGVCVNAQLNHDEPLLKAFEEGTQIMAARFLQPWLHPRLVFQKIPCYRVLMDYKELVYVLMDQIINFKKDVLKEKSSRNDMSNKSKFNSYNQVVQKEDGRKSILDLVMTSFGANGYSDTDLKEEILVLAMAGTDTSAVGASYTTIMLSRHQDIQEKVYQELQEVLGDTDRPIEAEDLLRLKYLDAVIRESLRLHPPAPVITRKIEKDITLPSGITLIEGTSIMVSIWGVHRNPKYWGADAEEFRPERFFDSAPKHPSAFMAFSCGPRNCLGYQYAMMSMKTVIASLLRQYKVLPPVPKSDPYCTDCQDIKHKPLRETYDIMMKDADKFTLRVKQRK